MSKLTKMIALILATIALCSCSSYSDQELDAIDSVVTALPHEVEGCTFLGDIDSNYGSYSIKGARDILKLKTAKMGGNHLVEINLAVRANYLCPSHILNTHYMDNDEFYMTGRAYYCPLGKGVALKHEQK